MYELFHAPHALRTFTHARTHRPTITTLVHPPSYTHLLGTHALFFAYRFFFVATLYQRASVSLVGTTLTKSAQLMNTHEMNALEYAAYVRLCLFLLMGGCALATATLWLSVYCDWRKSNRK